MTGRELAEKLSKLPEPEIDLPVMFIDEVWLRNVKTVHVYLGNEFGTQDDIHEHLRLE